MITFAVQVKYAWGVSQVGLMVSQTCLECKLDILWVHVDILNDYFSRYKSGVSRVQVLCVSWICDLGASRVRSGGRWAFNRWRRAFKSTTHSVERTRVLGKKIWWKSYMLRFSFANGVFYVERVVKSSKWQSNWYYLKVITSSDLIIYQILELI